MKIKNISFLLLGILVLSLVITMIFFPKQIIESSVSGFNLWIKSVFPSLLPFLICINILTKLGFVSFFGTLLTPVMRPLFGVDGVGAFPVVAGFTSGYPVGAKLTSELYLEKKLSKKDSEKLICFTNNCGPLFIIGAVGIGMFENPLVGYFILLIHIFSAILIGIMRNLFEKNSIRKYKKEKNIIKKAFTEMSKHIQIQNKPIGQILNESVYNSMITILTIGGFIIIFSVFSQEIKLLVPLPKNVFVESSFLGFIEMTNGLNIVCTNLSRTTVTIASFLISFGGLSIHAQSISFISKTDLNVYHYLLAKIIDGFLSSFLAFMLFPLINFQQAKPVFADNANSFSFFKYSIDNFFLLIIFIIILSFTGIFIHKKST